MPFSSTEHFFFFFPQASSSVATDSSSSSESSSSPSSEHFFFFLPQASSSVAISSSSDSESPSSKASLNFTSSCSSERPSVSNVISWAVLPYLARSSSNLFILTPPFSSEFLLKLDKVAFNLSKTSIILSWNVYTGSLWQKSVMSALAPSIPSPISLPSSSTPKRVQPPKIKSIRSRYFSLAL